MIERNLIAVNTKLYFDMSSNDKIEETYQIKTTAVGYNSSDFSNKIIFLKGNDFMNTGKGGYQILDCKNTNFTIGTKSIIIGSYEVMEGNYFKPVLVSHLVIAGTEYNDTFIQTTKQGTAFVGVLNTVWTNATNAVATIISVTDDDGITITTATITSAS